MYGVCKVCGCTENDPCFHPDWGMCSWVDDTHELCSHCADSEIYNDPQTFHCVNSSAPGLYIEEDGCPYPEREDCFGCPKYIENEGICDMEL